MTAVALELYLALFMALVALYWTEFFEPVQPIRRALLSAAEHLPERFLWVATPLYCAKCFAFWASLILAIVIELSVFSAFRVAVFSSAAAFLLTPYFAYEAEEEEE